MAKEEPGYCIVAEHPVLDGQYVVWCCNAGILTRDAALLEPRVVLYDFNIPLKK